MNTALKKILLKAFNFLIAHKEIFILLFLSLIFFYKLLLRPQEMIYPGGDIRAVYSFWRSFLVDSFFKFHSLPLWNPYAFSGMPFMGDPEAGFFYPFTLVFYIIPVNLAFGYLFIVDFFLIGLFTFLFSRLIKLSRFSSLVSATCMMLGGTFSLFVYEGHLFVADTIIWFVAILFCFELALSKKKPLLGLLSALPISLSLFSGHIQPLIFSLLATGIYILLRILFEKNLRKDFKTIVAYLSIPLISLIIGILLSSVTVLPSIELAKYSIRQNGLSFKFASDFSLPPIQLISFFLPHFFGSPVNSTYWGKGNFWSLCGYMGIIPIILAGFGIFLSKKKLALIFFVLGIFALLFSFGSYGPLFPLFYKFFPGFNNFRVPARFLFVYGFSFSILAGYGINYIFRSKKQTKLFAKKSGKIILSYGTIVFIFAFYMYFNTNGLSLFEKIILKNSYAQGIDHKIIYYLINTDVFYLSFFLISFGSILYLFSKKIISNNLSKILIFVIIIADLLIFGTAFYTTKNPRDVFKYSNEIAFIKNDPSKFRVFDLSGQKITFLNSQKLESATGINPVFLKDYQNFLWLAGDHLENPYENFFDFYNIKNTLVLKLLNIKYVISKNHLSVSGLSQIYHNEFFVYKVDDSLPRAYVVPYARRLSNQKDVLTFINNKAFSPKEEVIITDIIPFKKTSLTTFEKATITKYEPNKIVVYTKIPDVGYLVLSEIWYPGWNAYDNGKEVNILKGNGIIRVVPIEKGQHIITFIYSPDLFKIGAIISSFSFIIFIGIILVMLKKLNYGNFWKRKNKMSSLF